MLSENGQLLYNGTAAMIPRGEYLFPPKAVGASPPELVDSRPQQQLSLIPLERARGSEENNEA